MSLDEIILEQVKEEVTQQVTEEVKNKSLKEMVLKLQKNRFPNEQIAKILEIPLEKVNNLLAD